MLAINTIFLPLAESRQGLAQAKGKYLRNAQMLQHHGTITLPNLMDIVLSLHLDFPDK